MKKFLKILTTALGSLMVVCPQFDVYGMETTVKNKGFSLEEQIKEVEDFIKKGTAKDCIVKNETRHVATAVAVSILGENHDNDFLQSLNATYDEFIENGKNNDFCRIMGLLNAWIGTESVKKLRNDILEKGPVDVALAFDFKTIYKKSVDHIWDLLMNNNNRNWGNIVIKRFNEIYPKKLQVSNSDKSIAEEYFFHDWYLRFGKSQILNFVTAYITERRAFFEQTTIPNVKVPNNNKPDLKTELIDTTVKEKDSGQLSRGQSKTKAKNIAVVLQKFANKTLSKYFEENKINIHENIIDRGGQKLSSSQNRSGIRQKKIVKNVNENNFNQTSTPANVQKKNTQIQDRINSLNAKFSRVSDKQGEKKSINNNKNDSIAPKSEKITNMVSAINNNVRENNNNSVMGKLKVEEGGGAGVPPPPPPPPVPPTIKTAAEGQQRLAKMGKMTKIEKGSNNAKTESTKRVVSSNSGSQNNGKNAPRVQKSSTDMKDQLAAVRLAMNKKKQKAQTNNKNDQTKNAVNPNNFVLPKLRHEGVGKGVEIDYTKKDSVKIIWDAYKAVCVNSLRGSGNMVDIVKSKGATSGFGYLDKKSNLIKDSRTGLDSILEAANLLPIKQKFEDIVISNKYDVDKYDNIVDFYKIIKTLDQKKFARLQLYYMLKHVDFTGRIPILTGGFEKDKSNNKRVKKYATKNVFIDRDLLKKDLIPVFAYQYWEDSDTSPSTKFIGFKEKDAGNFENFNVVTDSELLIETGKENSDLARNQLYAIINTLIYKRFNEKWFDDKSE